MRGMGVSSWVGIVLVVLVVVLVVPSANGDTSPSQCKEERRLLVNTCRPVIFGRNPSADCCQRVRVTHVECVCPYVTPKLASLIGVERTIKQIQGCGRTVLTNSSVEVSLHHEKGPG